MKRKNYFLSEKQFLSEKPIKEILGENYVLSDIQKQRLEKVLKKYNDKELISNCWGKAVAYMIKNNLTNYLGRLRILKNYRKYGFYTTSLFATQLKCGRKEGERLYLENKKKRVDNLPSQMIYWIKKGYTEKEAKDKIKESNKIKSQISGNKLKGTSEYSCRSLAYWLKKGYTEEEAKKELIRIQGHGSLERYKEKYGKEIGLQKFNERQKKWQQTLDSKDDEEKRIINIKKSHTKEAYLLQGYTEEEAEKKSIEYFKKRNNYSSISQKFFSMLDEQLNEKIYYKLKNYEKQINGKNIDGYLPNQRIVIEFNGDYWHCRKELYDDNFIRYGKLAKDVRKEDLDRLNLILTSDKVSDIIIIWESDFRKNPNKIIEKVLEYINDERRDCNSKTIKEII